MVDSIIHVAMYIIMFMIGFCAGALLTPHDHDRWYY